MKLTYKEIITLIDYYENLVSQLESRMNDLEKIDTIFSLS